MNLDVTLRPGRTAARKTARDDDGPRGLGGMIDAAIGLLSPRAAHRRMEMRAATALLREFIGRRGYAAAGTGKALSGWRARDAGPHGEIGESWARLTARARQMVRDDPYAARIVGTYATSLVQTGIVPRPTADAGRGAARQSMAAWAAFADGADARGQLDIYGIQAQVARLLAESGEALVRRVVAPGRRVPVQLQVLEGDHLDCGRMSGANGRPVVDGIELGDWGQPVAYWVFRQHPQEMRLYGERALESVRVPASEMLHVFRPLRPGQLRGISRLAPVLLTLHRLHDYDEAELVRRQIQACLTAFVTRTDGGNGALGVEDAEDTRLDRLAPGLIEYLQPGEEISFSAPAQSSDYAPYADAAARRAAAGTGLMYEQVTGDMSRVNYSSYRGGALEMRAGIEADRWQVFIPQFCRPVWRWCQDAAFAAGLHRLADPRADWVPPAWPSVDPQKDAEAAIKRIRAGLQTLPEAIAELGYDPVVTLEEIAATNAEIDRLGLVLDSDPRQDRNVAAAPPADSTGDAPAEQAQAAP